MNKIAMLILAATLALTGCKTTGGGTGSGDPDEARLRAEIVRQWTWLRDMGCKGVDPEEAKKVRITVIHCSASGENRDGPYVCAPTACGKIESGCVHAWEQSAIRGNDVTFMLVGTQKDWCIRHEPAHFTHRRWCDNPAELAVNNGHPLAVHIGGKLIKTADLSLGARWPAALLDALMFWTPAEGSEFGCAILDESGEVLHLKPMPQQGLNGDGI